MTTYYVNDDRELTIMEQLLEMFPLFKKFKDNQELLQLNYERLQFIRGNRPLKLAHRRSIDGLEYEIIKDFIMYEMVEFRFAVFMLYYFGLRISEIVCVTNMNVRELVEHGETYIACTTIGIGRQIFLPSEAMKELLDLEAEIWKLFLKYRTKPSLFVMADINGIQFNPDNVALAINEKLREILEILEIEDTRYWTVGGFRTRFATDARHHGFFGLRDYENKWFFEDEPEMVGTNYVTTYYGIYDDHVPPDKEVEPNFDELMADIVLDPETHQPIGT